MGKVNRNEGNLIVIRWVKLAVPAPNLSAATIFRVRRSLLYSQRMFLFCRR